MGQKFVPKTSRNERFLAEFVTASPPRGRAERPSFPMGTKNPLQEPPIALKGGGAISAGAVFGHFSRKMAKNRPKITLSLYRSSQMSLAGTNFF